MGRSSTTESVCAVARTVFVTVGGGAALLGSLVAPFLLTLSLPENLLFFGLAVGSVGIVLFGVGVAIPGSYPGISVPEFDLSPRSRRYVLAGVILGSPFSLVLDPFYLIGTLFPAARAETELFEVLLPWHTAPALSVPVGACLVGLGLARDRRLPDQWGRVRAIWWGFVTRHPLATTGLQVYLVGVGLALLLDAPPHLPEPPIGDQFGGQPPYPPPTEQALGALGLGLVVVAVGASLPAYRFLGTDRCLERRLVTVGGGAMLLAGLLGLEVLPRMDGSIVPPSLHLGDWVTATGALGRDLVAVGLLLAVGSVAYDAANTLRSRIAVPIRLRFR